MAETSTSTATPELRLFVRSLKPAAGAGAVETALERLERLERDDYIQDYEVEIWGRQVPTTGPAAHTEPAAEIRGLVTDFRRWAGQHEVCIEPFFEKRTVTAELTDESYEALVLPNMALAEFEDGDLVHVAPHRLEHDIVNVTDRLAAFTGSGSNVDVREPSIAD